MKYYAHYGHRDFIVCLGYRGDVIQRFFRDEGGLDGCRLTYVETGIDANVGQRLRIQIGYLRLHRGGLEANAPSRHAEAFYCRKILFGGR